MSGKRTKRILVSMSPELYQEIKDLADSRGVSMSMIVNLSLQGGFVALKMSADPNFQKFYEGKDDQELTRLVTKMVKTGKPVKLPDGSIMGSEE